MYSNKTLFAPVIREIQNDLLDVGLLLDRAEASHPATLAPPCDQRLKRVQSASDATRRLATLLRPPTPRDYAPAKTLNILSGQVALESALPNEAEDASAPHLEYGDPEMIHECARLLTQNIRLQTGARLQGELSVQDDARLVLRIIPSGNLPERFTMDGYYDIDWTQLGGMWTVATQGGHIARAEALVIGYLNGDRPVAPTVEGAPEACVAEIMQQLTRLLRPWRNAIGVYEPGFMGLDDMVAMYRKTVQRAFELLEKLPQ